MPTVTVGGGAGYVGVSPAVFLADLGHRSTDLYKDPPLVAPPDQGASPCHEPGLPALLERTLETGILAYPPDASQALLDAHFVPTSVGTPCLPSEGADITAVAGAALTFARYATGHTIIANTSTLPVGPVAFVADIIAEHAAAGATFDMLSTPEPLR